MAKDDTVVRATMIIIKGLTIPASTAAWPIISPPTIPTVVPMGPDILVPDSLKSSNTNSIIKASKTAGNGTFILLAAK